jgi:hypothetical protein
VPTGGYPQGLAAASNADTKDHRVFSDTRFTLKHHSFKAKLGTRASNDVLGDPITIDYDFVKNPVEYSVSSWVNDPSVIEYSRFEEFNDALIRVNGNANQYGVPITNVAEPTNYAPRTQVWSLRESEAYMQGIRWNL